MNILIFAHSGAPGGAENALRYLVGLLIGRHHVEIVLPSAEHGEVAHYQSLGIPCHVLGVPWSLPDFSSGLLHYATIDFKNIAAILTRGQFDIAISNTIAILHGAIISSLMDIPHVFYAHEYLDEEDELRPTAIPNKSYLEMIDACSAGVVSCSRFVAGQFPGFKRHPLTVLEPYDYALEPVRRVFRQDAECVLQVIGVQSLRKNPQFAVPLVEALRLRGYDVRLDIIGRKHLASSRLERALLKRRINWRMLDHVPDPYAANQDRRVATLLCAGSEPYGLVIPESLRRAVPVISTRSGGPQELLPEELLYDYGNLDECVRKVERVFARYGDHVNQAAALYQSLSERKTRDRISGEIDQMLEHIRSTWRPPTEPTRLDCLVDCVATLVHPPVGVDDLADNISTVAMKQGMSWNAARVNELILEEKANPGRAVTADLTRFDAVAFCTSPQMGSLYRNGLGLAIELASTFDDPARLHMVAFIVCALEEMRRDLGRSPRILALGDGLGIDALRLARCGFDVDYMDVERSAMSDIARLNFDAVRRENADIDIRIVSEVETTYDAVVCLEVIEHVPEPNKFADAIAGYLGNGGLLFISDCFNGIEDRWPTHLYSNERYSGTLPFLLTRNFDFVGVNKMPFGKPFVFRKRADACNFSWLDILRNRFLVDHLISNQIDIGI
ncbi:methyltransferase domain-containing protein [Burkholderia sp. BCC0405]|uniref:methyltransferase domain-containing protein n=1 Tax=Burkholderia sp. BCC0405 TaxID=2676298 RepID=UPI0015889467|nr:methyltransferase domain-containing protein [Burkholderia sp. BCC0405]